MTGNEIRASIIVEHGRCQCSAWVCDPDCAACVALDPEWTCYHDAEHPWPAGDEIYVC
jgi:hypothetical protein